METQIFVLRTTANREDQVLDFISSNVLKKKLEDSNSIIAITNDGPKGPPRIAKPGSVKLAVKQNANMITMTATASKFFELKSWDKLRIPKPFGTIDLHISAPLPLDEDKINEVGDVEYLSNFMNFSSNMKFNSNILFGLFWEDKIKATRSLFSIDSTNGLFNIDEDEGVNYLKPEIISIALSYISDIENMMSINFEYNQVYYDDNYLKDYEQYKFGFEYLTQTGVPIRGGLMYRTAYISSLKPVSIFTFGSGKSVGNLGIDAAGTYCFQSFYSPDLFPVEGDVRPDYDLIRDSQFNLQLAFTYRF